MSRRLFILLFTLLIALVPSSALAQDEEEKVEGFTLQINSPYVLQRGETIGSAVVIGDNALIAGTVRDGLLVISGDVTIAGAVEDSVTIIRGDLTLQSGSRVHDVFITNGDLIRESGAVVDGNINHNARGFGFLSVAFLFILWLSLSVAVVLTGMLFAAIGGRQLAESSRVLTGELAYSILGAVVLWIGVPLVAVLAMITIVGIPFGLALMMLVLPLLWLLGYIVAGARLGALLLRFRRSEQPVDHPYLEALSGLVLLQLVALIPFIGWIVLLIAGAWGSGALAVAAFRAWRGRGAAPEIAPAG